MAESAEKTKFTERLTAYLSKDMDKAVEAARFDIRRKYDLKTDKSMFVRAALQVALDSLVSEGESSQFYRCLSELEAM